MKTLVIAPHADDEILGAGGTLFKRNSKKTNSIYWLLITMPSEPEYEKKFILKREKQIKKIIKFVKFKGFYNLELKPTELDKIPKKKLIKKITEVINTVKPDEIFVPHLGDVHSDHKIISDIISTCTKNFRFSFIKSILAYEVLSETNFNLNKKNYFKPNYYEDISKFLDKKIKAMKIYKSEIKKFPFPRSQETIKSLAKVRGSEISTKAAEAFEILKKIN
tara:strand:+ start:363 stop:1025 length:663 start_codon:yes stop_codon:yes gene_type:complete